MPGITGIIRKYPSHEAGRDLRIMIDEMRHETFYNSGQYINEDLGLYAGWICHQGAFSDCMPLISRNKDVVLIFHGENYLDSETATRLRNSGNSLDESNALYLLDLYCELGDDLLTRLNGWYCGLIVNLRTKRIILFNDRYGMSRIYFHEGKDEFIFASEAKSLLKIRSALRTIDPEGLAEYLRYSCVTTNRSLFKGISLLPYASMLEFEAGAPVRRRRYFQFSEWEAQPSIDPTEFYSKFAETVTRVFPAYVQDPENVALSLTAGLDTRLVVAALGEHHKARSSYTFGGPWGELYDIRTARELSTLYNQPFKAIRVNGDFLRNFSNYAPRTIYLSDGTHDAFGAHDVYFNRIAREIAPIRLTGKFGSEVVRIRRLSGSGTYKPGFLPPELNSLIDELPPISQIGQPGHPLTKVVTEQIPWYEFGRVAVEQSQLTLRTPYMDNALVKLMYEAPDGTRAAGDLQENYVRNKSPELSAFPTNLGRFVSNSRMITKLMNFWFRALFKVEYIYLYATPHWLTRIDRILERLRLERILAGRQKWEGYRIWIKTDFADFIRQTLFDSAAQYTNCFDRRTVERMVTSHIAGTHNYLNEINKVLTIELVYSSLIRR
jgi:asparagine synthase (glutamine-hydrolysing)